MTHDLPPEDSAEDERIRKLVARQELVQSLTKAAATFLAIAGGITAVATVIVPTRTAGASRSAHLEWQRRQAEIARVASTPTPPGDTTAP